MFNKFSKRIVSLFIVCVLIVSTFSGCAVIIEYPSESATDGLEIVFIDVGQGDSELIICDGHAMLIDAGEASASANVLNCLYSHGITEIEYLVATHVHADHIGGMTSIINNMQISNILMPDSVTTTNTFEKMLNAIIKNNLVVDVPVPGETFYLGDAKCTVIAPNSDEYTDLNEYSIVIILEYANRRIMFSGDSDKKSHAEILEKYPNVSVDVYKVAHHGSADNNRLDWIEAVNPDYAIISCDGKSYKHPSDSTLENLALIGTTVYRTDKNGSVTLNIDTRGNMTFITEK